MRRREFIALIGGVTATAPFAVGAQQSEPVPRIGVLMGYAETDPSAQAQVEALRQGLQRLGWRKGAISSSMFAFPRRMQVGYAPASRN